jgi:hypothetical protein
VVIKRFQISRWGSNQDFFCEKYLQNKLSTNEPIPMNIEPIDSARQAETQETSKYLIFSKVILGEQPGNFRQKTLKQLPNRSTDFQK